jgi:hypothetical protein
MLADRERAEQEKPIPNKESEITAEDRSSIVPQDRQAPIRKTQSTSGEILWKATQVPHGTKPTPPKLGVAESSHLGRMIAAYYKSLL